MSLLRRRDAASDLIAERTGRAGLSTAARVTTEQAMRQSVVWAARRLRADLVSLMPIDVYRASKAGGVNVSVAAPRVLVTPSEVAQGHPMLFGEWMFSSQMALDGFGNAVGVIRAVDAFGLPAQIDLVPAEEVSMRIRSGRVVEYRLAGEKTDPRFVWHERQFTTAGVPVGMSPLAYAALSLAAGLSAQQFALDWFANGTVPKAVLRNEEKVIDPAKADVIKRRFRQSVGDGDVFVTGKDWTYNPISAKASEAAFVEQSKLSDVAMCRYLGVPGDLVDVGVDSSTINYANITQRNLQILIMNMGSGIKRREDTITALALPRPQFAKLNRAAILAMDEKGRAELFKMRIEARITTPDEARAKDDLPPLTDADYEQFGRLFGSRTPNPAPIPGGAS